jgi:hypothetical protein
MKVLGRFNSRSTANFLTLTPSAVAGLQRVLFNPPTEGAGIAPDQAQERATD